MRLDEKVQETSVVCYKAPPGAPVYRVRPVLGSLERQLEILNSKSYLFPNNSEKLGVAVQTDNEKEKSNQSSLKKEIVQSPPKSKQQSQLPIKQQSQPQTKKQPQTQNKQQSQPQTKQQSHPQSKPQSQSQTKQQSQSQTKQQPQTQIKQQSQSLAKQESQPQAKQQSQPPTKQQSQSQTKQQSQTQTKQQPQSQTKQQSESQTKQQPQTQTKQQSQSEVKQQSQSSTKQQSQSQTKQQSQSQTKPQTPLPPKQQSQLQTKQQSQPPPKSQSQPLPKQQSQSSSIKKEASATVPTKVKAPKTNEAKGTSKDNNQNKTPISKNVPNEEGKSKEKVPLQKKVNSVTPESLTKKEKPALQDLIKKGNEINSKKSSSQISSNSSIIRPPSISPLKTLPVKPRLSAANLKGSPKQSKSTMCKPSVLSTSSLSLIRTGSFNFDRYKRYKTKVLQAVQDKKVFLIYGGYNCIRNALLKRGWVEKLLSNPWKELDTFSLPELIKNAKDGNNYEVLALSRLLAKYSANFIWQPKRIVPYDASVVPYRNRIRRSKELDFTVKEGLIACIENSHWNCIDGVSAILAPKYHCLIQPEDLNEFRKDYRIQYCISLLLYLSEIENPAEMFVVTGSVSTKIIDFALKRVKEAISNKTNGDLDTPVELEEKVTDQEWLKFIVDADNIQRYGQKFLGKDGDHYSFIPKVKETIFSAKQVWPNLAMYGTSNVWIMKPSNRCRGIGIILMTNCTKMIEFAKKRMNLRYIVQKYIERPLLIYKTKFDIRQYVLITVNDSINIWMYKDCYLRFSSQEYSLKDLRESVHITNNAVQCKYRNGNRSPNLPVQNMWSLNEYKEYLKTINKQNIWRDKVYPKMKENLIGVVLSSLEQTEIVPNTFEIYGCDFMITENYDPILIEINATPDMKATTAITAKICPAALEDVIRVVVDLPKDKKADTGNFELAYSMPRLFVGNYSPGLVIQGTSIKSFSLSSTSQVTCPNKQFESNQIISSSAKSDSTPLLSRRNETNFKPIQSLPSKTRRQRSAQRASKLVSTSADQLIRQSVAIIKTINQLKPSMKNNTVIANNVTKVIENLYDLKRKSYSPDKKEKTLSEAKRALESEIEHCTSEKHSLFHDEKILKTFMQILYKKIWK